MQLHKLHKNSRLFRFRKHFNVIVMEVLYVHFSELFARTKNCLRKRNDQNSIRKVNGIGKNSNSHLNFGQNCNVRHQLRTTCIALFPLR